MAATTVQVKGVGIRAYNELASKARKMGMTPARYVRELVEEDLALDRKARTTSLREIMGPGRDIDEKELDELVERARDEHHLRTSRKR